MAQSLTVSYDLHPPASTSAPTNLSANKSQEFPINSKGEGQKGYYESLRVSIGEAKATLGAELTAWRDAVGTAEQSKEGKKIVKEDEDEEEEEDEE